MAAFVVGSLAMTELDPAAELARIGSRFGFRSNERHAILGRGRAAAAPRRPSAAHLD
jgi:hypothetical protein